VLFPFGVLMFLVGQQESIWPLQGLEHFAFVQPVIPEVCLEKLAVKQKK